MVVLSRSIHRASNYITWSYHTRLISVYAPVNAAHGGSTKTVKDFAELPTTFLRPDGTTAEPLPEWRAEPDSLATDRKLKKAHSHSLRKEEVSKANTTESRNTLFTSPIPCNTDYGGSKSKRGRKPRKQTKLASLGGTENLEPVVDIRDSNDGKLSPIEQRGARGKLTRAEFDASRTERKRAIATKSKILEVNDIVGQPQNVLAKEILENLKKYPHCLLLTRVGQFYESYFDQATEISRLLNIKLTSRKWDGSRIPMCGFPLIHIDKQLKILVQQNKRFVAMCEEFPHLPDQGIKVFDRRVVRIITPGTLIDESFLNPYENNYLLSVSIPELPSMTPLGLAWIDVSTGEFFSKSTTFDSLRDELTRIAPREVVLDKRLESVKSHPVFQTLAEDGNLVSFACLPKAVASSESSSPETYAITMNNDVPPPETNQEFTRLSLSHQEASAISLLTAYLHANLLEHMPLLSSPNQEGMESRMQIDSHTIKALEIREEIREGSTKGALLNAIKKTITSGGTRLLTRWLCSPSTSIPEISARQSLVALFCARPHFRADLGRALAGVEDTGRIVQKLISGRGDTNDLLSVKRTTHIWTNLIKRIEDEKQLEAIEREDFNPADWKSIDALMSRMVDLQDLSKRISFAMEDTPPINNEFGMEKPPESNISDSHDLSSDVDSNIFWRYGPGKWMIKPGFSSILTTLHTSLRGLLNQREELERSLQLTYDAPSLTLRASPGQGMHVHLARAKRDQAKLNVTPEFITISESGSTRCYFYKEWSQLGSQIAETMAALNTTEKEAFEALRIEVTGHSPPLRRNARIIDELDVALALANLATEMNFVKPFLTDDPIYEVQNGRHPTVELGLLAAGRVFTPNSIKLSPMSRLHIITGPNMAGKSTFLRQTALIAILAQIGSFVPADHAVIGIVDKLFSRVGAKDDLFHNRSTFMVEMLETAEILRRATSKSLVIMDEVGRGTTVVDGLAIAYATIHHLVSKNQCRSLFATHFHELADMLEYPNNRSDRGTFSSVDFFCTDVVETNDNHFAYQYRVCPGVNRDSHGLKVAQLSGMPPEAMAVAKNTLSMLKARRFDHWNDMRNSK